MQTDVTRIRTNIDLNWRCRMRLRTSAYTPCGVDRSGWKVVYADSEELASDPAGNVLDGHATTFWHTEWRDASPPHPHEI